MDPTIEAAYIGGLFTLIAGIFGSILGRMTYPVFKGSTQNKDYSALSGLWTGRALQSGLGDFGVTLNIEATAKGVIGKGVVSSYSKENRGPDIPILFRGEYLDGDYLRIEYKPSERKRGFGIIIFRLSNYSTELDGVFAGSGLKSQNPVSGEVKLTRQP